MEYMSMTQVTEKTMELRLLHQILVCLAGALPCCRLVYPRLEWWVTGFLQTVACLGQCFDMSLPVSRLL